MHRCKMNDFITLENGKITRVINAKWKEKEITVYKENEDSDFFSRYLYFSKMGGYLVCFPDEEVKFDNFNTCSVSWIDSKFFRDWSRAAKCNIFCEGGNLSEVEINNILYVYPDFQYVLKKWDSENRKENLKNEI